MSAHMHVVSGAVLNHEHMAGVAPHPTINARSPGLHAITDGNRRGGLVPVGCTWFVQWFDKEDCPIFSSFEMAASNTAAMRNIDVKFQVPKQMAAGSAVGNHR